MNSQYIFPERHTKTIRLYYDAILQLVSRCPLEKITVQMILDVSETSRSTFYSYFRDKYHLVYYVLYYNMKTIQQNLYRGREDYSRMITAYFAFIREHVTFYQRIFQSDDLEDFRFYYTDMQKEVLRRNMIDRIGKEDYRRSRMEQYVSYSAGGMTNVVYDWIDSGCRSMTPEELTEFLLRYYPMEYF